MDEKIKVTVAQWGQGRNLMLRWTDPETGERRAETSGTKDWGEAEDKAAVLAHQINTGEYVPPAERKRRKSVMSWEDFTSRHEREVQPGQAEKTRLTYRTVFSAVERIIHPKRLNGLTAARLSHFQAVLRDEGKSEHTIKSYLAHLKAAMRWAVDVGMLKECPKFPKTVRAKKGKAMKGRPLCTEEYERMLLSVGPALTQRPNRQRKKPAPPTAEVVESWRHLLRGLWTGGWRLGEALELSWDRRDKLCIDLTGRRPMVHIPGECQKSGKDELYPVAPEFVELILQTPPERRKGRVFRPMGVRGKTSRLGLEYVSAVIARIGEKAGVVVNEKTKKGPNGKPVRVVKYASAHDLRRSFGDRWKDRVMPLVLQQMMRHEDLSTTLNHYTSRNADNTAEAIWAAYPEGDTANQSDEEQLPQRGANGNGCGNTRRPARPTLDQLGEQTLEKQGFRELGY